MLGTRTFSVRDQDPFRPLIQFFKDPSKFPSLRKVKITFDLWGCETSGTSLKEVSGYRGWRELDDVFASLDSTGGRCRSGSVAPLIGKAPMASRERQLVGIVFELWCSPSYKAGLDEHLADGSPSLSALIREELSYLKQNTHFVLL